MSGPLTGYKIIEFAGIGPGPFCSMLLSDMGAEVLRLDRTEDAGLGIPSDTKYALLNRGRRSVALTQRASGKDEAAAAAAVDAAGGSVKLAILMLRAGLDADAARARLDAVDGNLRAALGE